MQSILVDAWDDLANSAGASVLASEPVSTHIVVFLRDNQFYSSLLMGGGFLRSAVLSK